MAQAEPLWFDDTHTHAAAGVFLLTQDRRVVLQLRDNRPDIDNPGKITSFGGGAESGETPVDCALRELREETGLTPSPGDLRLLGSVSRIDFRGNPTASAFFLLAGVDPNALEITEGTAILLTFAEAAGDGRLTETCRTMVSRIGEAE